jgi:hypothetical protein
MSFASGDSPDLLTVMVSLLIVKQTGPLWAVCLRKKKRFTSAAM